MAADKTRQEETRVVHRLFLLLLIRTALYPHIDTYVHRSIGYVHKRERDGERR